MAGRGSVLTIGAVRTGSDLEARVGYGTYGDCLLDDAAASLPPQVAYAPGCPAVGGAVAYGQTGSATWISGMASNITAGSCGAGFWYATTPTTQADGAVSVWLTNLHYK